ncbi:MAG: Sporulation kinase A [Parcubacteria group bacterium ADurb.Bin216]|nr:MAG: Sporulation kinase A [Parcubacteria group bacterium ADurb.Bin216]
MNHYLRLIDSLDQVIFEADLEGRLIFLNESGVKKFGYTKESLIGKVITDFVHPKHHERVKEALADIFLEEY